MSKHCASLFINCPVKIATNMFHNVWTIPNCVTNAVHWDIFEVDRVY